MRKSLLVVVMMLSCQIFDHTPAFGGEGGAILPSWFKDLTPWSTSIFVSNVSDEQVTVYLTLYDENGNIYNESSESGTNFLVVRGFSGDPLSTSGATLQANRTGEFRILGTGATQTGYGQIKWTSAGYSRVALIAFARYTVVASSGTAMSVVPVNRLEPF